MRGSRLKRALARSTRRSASPNSPVRKGNAHSQPNIVASLAEGLGSSENFIVPLLAQRMPGLCVANDGGSVGRQRSAV